MNPQVLDNESEEFLALPTLLKPFHQRWLWSLITQPEWADAMATAESMMELFLCLCTYSFPQLMCFNVSRISVDRATGLCSVHVAMDDVHDGFSSGRPVPRSGVNGNGHPVRFQKADPRMWLSTVADYSHVQI